MQSLWNKYSSENVIFVAVHKSWVDTSDTKVKDWLLSFGVTFCAIQDDPPNPISSNYGVTGVPCVFIIGPDMKIAKVVYGFHNCDEIEAALSEAIALHKVPISRYFGRYRFGPVDVPRWMKVAYLLVNMLSKDIFNTFEARPSEKFNTMVQGHLEAYLQKGKMPPKEIASAILNLADEYASGRVMTLRAGDYFALQNYMRKGSR